MSLVAKISLTLTVKVHAKNHLFLQYDAEENRLGIIRIVAQAYIIYISHFSEENTDNA